MAGDRTRRSVNQITTSAAIGTNGSQNFRFGVASLAYVNLSADSLGSSSVWGTQLQISGPSYVQVSHHSRSRPMPSQLYARCTNSVGPDPKTRMMAIWQCLNYSCSRSIIIALFHFTIRSAHQRFGDPLSDARQTQQRVETGHMSQPVQKVRRCLRFI